MDPGNWCKKTPTGRVSEGSIFENSDCGDFSGKKAPFQGLPLLFMFERPGLSVAAALAPGNLTGFVVAVVTSAGNAGFGFSHPSASFF